jgi:hypothetical protein
MWWIIQTKKKTWKIYYNKTQMIIISDAGPLIGLAKSRAFKFPEPLLSL